MTCHDDERRCVECACTTVTRCMCSRHVTIDHVIHVTIDHVTIELNSRCIALRRVIRVSTRHRRRPSLRCRHSTTPSGRHLSGDVGGGGGECSLRLHPSTMTRRVLTPLFNALQSFDHHPPITPSNPSPRYTGTLFLSIHSTRLGHSVLDRHRVM